MIDFIPFFFFFRRTPLNLTRCGKSDGKAPVQSVLKDASDTARQGSHVYYPGDLLQTVNIPLNTSDHSKHPLHVHSTINTKHFLTLQQHYHDNDNLHY